MLRNRCTVSEDSEFNSPGAVIKTQCAHLTVVCVGQTTIHPMAATIPLSGTLQQWFSYQGNILSIEPFVQLQKKTNGHVDKILPNDIYCSKAHQHGKPPIFYSVQNKPTVTFSVTSLFSGALPHSSLWPRYTRGIHRDLPLSRAVGKKIYIDWDPAVTHARACDKSCAWGVFVTGQWISSYC